MDGSVPSVVVGLHLDRPSPDSFEAWFEDATSFLERMHHAASRGEGFERHLEAFRAFCSDAARALNASTR